MLFLKKFCDQFSFNQVFRSRMLCSCVYCTDFCLFLFVSHRSQCGGGVEAHGTDLHNRGSVLSWQKYGHLFVNCRSHRPLNHFYIFTWRKKCNIFFLILKKVYKKIKLAQSWASYDQFNESLFCDFNWSLEICRSVSSGVIVNFSKDFKSPAHALFFKLSLQI